MSLTGGKRKVNKSLKAWVTFVKKVQKEEKLSYKEAIHRAKVRKDKGEKWMSGGGDTTPGENMDMGEQEEVDITVEEPTIGGRRRRRTMRRSRGRSRSHKRSARRSRSRSSRRH